MKWLKGLVQRLANGGSSDLRDYEQACLDVFMQSLTPDQADVLRQQVAAVDQVSRQAKDKVVILRQLKAKAGVDFPVFANTDLDRNLAVLHLKAGFVAFTADVLTCEGEFGGFIFSRSPKGLDMSTFDVVTVKPLRGPNDPPPIPIELSAAGPLTARIAEAVPIRDVVAPAPAATIDAFLERLVGGYPPDYRRLLEETDGFKFEGGAFEGTRGRVLPWPDEVVQITAEDPNCWWALTFRQTEANALMLDEIDVEFEDYGSDYVDALIRYMRYVKQRLESEANE